MKAIRKFTLTLADRTELSLPRGYKILNHISQSETENNSFILWVLCDDEQPELSVGIRCLKDNVEIPDDIFHEIKYIDSVDTRFFNKTYHFFVETPLLTQRLNNQN